MMKLGFCLILAALFACSLGRRQNRPCDGVNDCPDTDTPVCVIFTSTHNKLKDITLIGTYPNDCKADFAFCEYPSYGITEFNRTSGECPFGGRRRA